MVGWLDTAARRFRSGHLGQHGRLISRASQSLSKSNWKEEQVVVYLNVGASKGLLVGLEGVTVDEASFSSL